jgi:hypothetical protein
MTVDGRHHRGNDRREQDDEAPEDERVHQPGHEPLQQLLLAEHDRRLVADAHGDVTAAVDGLSRQNKTRQEQGAAREKPAGDEKQRRERNRAYDVLLSSALIAGTISCRSPITA